MSRCCCTNAEKEKDNKFTVGGENDISEGPVQRRSCTDVFCIPVFILAQLAFIGVTVMGLADGNPARLYRPRDYRGAYCGAEQNWNGGPDTSNAPMLSYTMNMFSTTDVIMKQLVCSSVSKSALESLLTSPEFDEYLCDCCLVPCGRCDGALDNGGDLKTGSQLQSTISARMAELTNASQAAKLFSPTGANGDLFGSATFWEYTTKYFNAVCLPSCNTSIATINASSGVVRTYLYSPAKDDPLYLEWRVLLNSSLASDIKATMEKDFTFQALPYSVCPYEPELCVPMPGVAFSKITFGSDFCTFEMSADVIDAIGSAAASTFESIGGSSMVLPANEELGKWAGDFQKTIDTFAVVSASSFIVGLVFLILVRFFVGCCVWLTIFMTVLMFFFGGFSTYVLSGQCKGATLMESGQQTVTAVLMVVKTGEDSASERMDPQADGSDYRGAQRRTKTGKLCLNWADQTDFPKYTAANYNRSDLVSNFCRNPYHEGDANKATMIWCITGVAHAPWEECVPIGVFRPQCLHGYAIDTQKMRDTLWGASFVIWAVGLIWIIVIMCFVRRIRLAIALNKVAAVFLGNNPHILWVPIMQAVIAIAGSVTWMWSASFLLSQVPAGYTPTGHFETYEEAQGTVSTCAFWEFGEDCKGTKGQCADRWPMGLAWKDNNCEMDGDVAKCWRCAQPRFTLDLRFAWSVFIYLWNNAFNAAFGQIVIAMAVSVWFFTGQKSQTPVVARAFRTVVRYHLGSVALGSFVVAVVQFVRYVVKYIEKQSAAQNNRVMVFVLKCLQCCIWCFEKIVQFLNKNAYIQIALLGKPFCTSAKKAFFLILRNAVRFGTLAALSGMVHSIGFIFIMTGTGVIGFFLLREMHPDVSPFMPLVCFSCVSYVVARIYMNVFGLAVDTSLQCFLAVEEMGVAGEYVPYSLRRFMNSGAEAKDREVEEEKEAEEETNEEAHDMAEEGEAKEEREEESVEGGDDFENNQQDAADRKREL